MESFISVVSGSECEYVEVYNHHFVNFEIGQYIRKTVREVMSGVDLPAFSKILFNLGPNPISQQANGFILSRSLNLYSHLGRWEIVSYPLPQELDDRVWQILEIALGLIPANKKFNGDFMKRGSTYYHVTRFKKREFSISFFRQDEDKVPFRFTRSCWDVLLKEKKLLLGA